MCINIIQIPHVDKVIKKQPKLAKIKRSVDATKLLLTYCGVKAFQKKKQTSPMFGANPVLLQVPVELKPDINIINKEGPVQDGYHTKYICRQP